MPYWSWDQFHENNNTCSDYCDIIAYCCLRQSVVISDSVVTTFCVLILWPKHFECSRACLDFKQIYLVNITNWNLTVVNKLWDMKTDLVCRQNIPRWSNTHCMSWWASIAEYVRLEVTSPEVSRWSSTDSPIPRLLARSQVPPREHMGFKEWWTWGDSTGEPSNWYDWTFCEQSEDIMNYIE